VPNSLSTARSSAVRPSPAARGLRVLEIQWHPEEGHDVQLINFSRPGEPVQLQLQRFAHNSTFEQAFVGQIHGINRPVDLKFGPDDCAYLVDYGAVRDFGQSDPDSKFRGANNGPLLQIPGTGVVWKICRVGEREADSDQDD